MAKECARYDIDHNNDRWGPHSIPGIWDFALLLRYVYDGCTKFAFRKYIQSEEDIIDFCKVYIQEYYIYRCRFPEGTQFTLQNTSVDRYIQNIKENPIEYKNN